jgi:parallel beta-helix repeat protein
MRIKYQKPLILIIIIIIQLIIPSINSQRNINHILYVDDSGDGDYISITDALNNATDGDTIFVFNGYYNEFINIDKSVFLIGEDKNNTFIDVSKNNRTTDFPSRSIITILAHNVKIMNFTFKNIVDIKSDQKTEMSQFSNLNYSYVGIEILSDSNQINGNSFCDNNGYDIFIKDSSDNKLSNNIFNNNSNTSIILKNSSTNKIFQNNFKDNEIAIIIETSSYNNTIFHNNFLNAGYMHAQDFGNNLWYNISTKEGNYWDDNKGYDYNYDGIGDNSYKIYGNKNQDNYPLIQPFNFGLSDKNEFSVSEETILMMLFISVLLGISFLIMISILWKKIKK